MILGVVGIGIGLGLAEVGARRFESVRCVGEGDFLRRDPLTGWGNRPGATGIAQGCANGVAEFAVPIRINAKGLRGREAPYERSLGTFRVLVLGDSFTFGGQVDERDHFLTLLAAAIERRRPGRRVEVLNAGVDAWGTDNTVNFYEAEGWRYAADLVLLGFNGANDVFENSRRMVSTSPGYPDKPYFDLVDGQLLRRGYPLPPENDASVWFRAALVRSMHDSALARLVIRGPLRQRWVVLPPPRRAADAVDAVPFGVMLSAESPSWDEAWQITEALIGRLEASTRQQGARLATFLVASREEVSPAVRAWVSGFHYGNANPVLDPDKPSRLGLAMMGRQGVPSIPLVAPFRAQFDAGGAPMFFGWDIHWTPVGHALAAGLIADALERQGLLDLPRPPSP